MSTPYWRMGLLAAAVVFVPVGLLMGIFAIVHLQGTGASVAPRGAAPSRTSADARFLSIVQLHQDFDRLRGRRVCVHGSCVQVDRREEFGYLCVVLLEGRLLVDCYSPLEVSADFANAEGGDLVIEGDVAERSKGRGVVLRRCRRLFP